MVLQNSNDKVSNKLFANKEINTDIKKAHEKVKKVILNVVTGSDLEFRDISITSDGNYLVACSEISQNEQPKITIWNIEELREGKTEPEVILKGELKNSEYVRNNNWLLCVDTLILEINNLKWWIICAGSIIGGLYTWFGKIDDVSGVWNFEEYKCVIFAESSEGTNEYPKSIHDLKMIQDSIQKNSCHIYFGLNNTYTLNNAITKDNVLKKLSLTLDNSGNISKKGPSINLGIQDEWITCLDIYTNKEDLNKSYLVSGSRDGIIFKYNLVAQANPVILGKHNDSITCVKIFENGSKIASSCVDNTIKIWKNTINGDSELINELLGHIKSVVSIDIQKNNKFLISISKDNTIKIWDLNRGTWIRNIDMVYFMNLYDENSRNVERGIKFLRCVKITPQNQYFYVTLENRIVIIKNFGALWHFKEQLKFIREMNKDLYAKIYGVNLLQMARNTPESIENLNKLYELIKKRIKNRTEIDLALNLKAIEGVISDYNKRELGPLFIPSFIEFEKDIKSQKEYILGVKENYDAYWRSVKNLFFKLPELPWQFKLYITTDVEEDIKEAKFVEVTNPNIEDSVYIIMKDRGQTLIRFLMVLENVPTGFIPLIDSINVEIEDDRGDKDNLVFSDFTYSPNFIKILTKPRVCLDEFKTIKKPESIFYTFCTFQLEEGYSTEDFVNIFTRRITLEITKNLNPIETSSSVREDIDIFESFKNTFQLPLIPKIQIQVGKGIASTVGKIIDEYFAKLIIVEFIFSFWGFIEIGIPALIPGLEIPAIVSSIIAVSGIVIIGLIFMMMFLKK